MSTFDEENIDRLFNSLEDHSMEADFDQFGDMEIRLEKLRYFRFGWKHFNIYYSILIGLSILPSLWLIGSYLMQSPAQQNVVVVAQDSTPVVQENVPVPQSAQPGETKIVYIYKDDKHSAPDTVIKIIEAAPAAPAPVIHDTVQVPAPKVQRKIVVIPKRDTIIKIDTTKKIKRK